jgi:hypothetical protein
MASSTTVSQYLWNAEKLIRETEGYGIAPYKIKFPRSSHDGFANKANGEIIGGLPALQSQIIVQMDDNVTEDKLAYSKGGNEFVEISYPKDK